jgi:hypothetical protein
MARGSPPNGQVTRPIPRTRRVRRPSTPPRCPYRGAVISTGRRASRPIVAGRIVAAQIVTGLLAGLLLAGCSGSTAPDPSTSTGPRPLPTTSTAPPDAPASAEVELPWPAATAADAAALQAQVDRGSQPWLLDPSEVAIAYAAAAHDWPDAEAYPGPDGTSVDVRNADGERLTLTLAQPARTGNDGIWVVTAERG